MVNIKQIGNSYIIILAVFVSLFFVLNEKIQLHLGPEVFIPIALVVGIGLVILSKKVNISDYVMLPAIIGDGFFHTTAPLTNLVENSPDWVIAFNLYGGNGMPVIVHQMMGVFLITTSAFFIYFLAVKSKNWYRPFYKYAITIVTLTIISFSYVIKMFN